MNGVVFAFTEAGKATALRVAAALGGCALKAPARLAGGAFERYEESLPDCVGALFDRDALVFVGAAGIAVRAVAPHVRDKRADPAVLCVDERARFVIPLLSGHIGGANRLARSLAAALGATAVITTATDVNGRFSVDAFAAERGMGISSMALAKKVSAEVLARDIPFYTDMDCGPLPEGLIWADSGALGVCVSFHDLKPFGETLLLTPKALIVGIGCRKGVPEASISAAVEAVFAQYHLRPDAVAGAASVDLKRGEPGLLSFCERMGWPVEFYPADALNRVPGDFAGSEFVRRTVGTDNVCERAALARGGRLVASKTAIDGVTVAVAALEWRLDFG